MEEAIDYVNESNFIIEKGELLKYIGNALESITIPDSVTSIGREAFYGCRELTKIEIPSGVTSIGDAAFGGCSGLTSITVDSGNTKYDSRNNSNAIIETESNRLIAGCKNTVIPDNVTSIGECAFYGCYNLINITIPERVKSIDDEAFKDCFNLESVIIPKGSRSIGKNVFIGTKWLEKQKDDKR